MAPVSILSLPVKRDNRTTVFCIFFSNTQLIICPKMSSSAFLNIGAENLSFILSILFGVRPALGFGGTGECYPKDSCNMCSFRHP